jgi:hypothetical protein
MIKRLERLKNAVNKYVANIQPHRLTACQSERKSVLSQPSVLSCKIGPRCSIVAPTFKATAPCFVHAVSFLEGIVATHAW